MTAATTAKIDIDTSRMWELEPKTPSRRQVQGVGATDMGPATKSVDGKTVKHAGYQLWVSMLDRVYSPRIHAKHPTYIGTQVCDRWLTFSNFHADMSKRYGYGAQGWNLDKDILGDGKLYSPETCAFIPQQINKLMIDSAASTGAFPQWVAWQKQRSKFLVQVAESGKHQPGTTRHFTDVIAATQYAIQLKHQIAVRTLIAHCKDHPQFIELLAGVDRILEQQADRAEAKAAECQELFDAGLDWETQHKAAMTLKLITSEGRAA